ncbi:MAG: hypothetical protein LBV44_01295 [Methylobacillus sp.]|jgi:hypothetical protein|nr:hypothetical protein [Methylobacillus sp.]
MMNPEFRRNLWLSFSTHRLIAMPALLALIFLTAAITAVNVPLILYNTASILFILIAWGWGALNAGASIVDEFREKTWDQQRMSALGSWTMTWGKLFGATAFNWYGGAICLLVMVVCGTLSNRPNWVLEIPTLIAASILTHAMMIASNLYAGRFDSNFFRRGGAALIVLLFVVVGIGLQATAMRISNPEPGSTVVWWGMVVGDENIFLLESALLFMVCATIAAWRLMSNALQIRTLPWALPLFVLILAVYCGGFAEKKWFSLIGFAIAAGFSYIMLLTEPNTLLLWNKLRLRLQTGDWRSLLAELPLWTVTFLLTLVFALAVMLTWPFAAPDTRAIGALIPLVATVLLLRDVCIVLFFSFAPNARRPIAVAVLYIIVLNFLLPYFFEKLGLRAAAYFCDPVSDLFDTEPYGTVTLSLLIASIHAAFMLGIVIWRFNKIRRQTG